MSTQHRHRPSLPVSLCLVYAYLEFDGEYDERRVAYFLTRFESTREAVSDVRSQSDLTRHYTFGEAEALAQLYQGEHPKWLTVAMSDEGAAPVGSKLHMVRAFLCDSDTLPDEAFDRWIVSNAALCIDARGAASAPVDTHAFRDYLLDNGVLSHRLKHALRLNLIKVEVSEDQPDHAKQIVFRCANADVCLSMANIQQLSDAFEEFRSRTEAVNKMHRYSQESLAREIETAWAYRIAVLDPV